MRVRRDVLRRFLFLYGTLYGSFGLASPFLPAFLTARGVAPEALGLLLGAGTAVRLLSAPLAGRAADVYGAFRFELVLFAILAALACLLYLPVHSFWMLALVNLAQAAMLAPLVPLSDAAHDYAAPSLQAGRDWLEAVSELMHRIHLDFEFEPGATTVSTSVDEVLAKRHGVCQDFAHLLLACLRTHGLPARYVSGYLLTDPPPGQPRLMGVDASHAWVAAFSPNHGWVEFDPTNDQLADQRYITLGWGADFADVVPLRGVILGGGTQEMQVSVSVVPA